MTPAALLREARRLVDDPSPVTSGWWGRAAVILARQALEACVAELVARRGGDPRQATWRAQLLVLPELLADRDLAARASWTWAALSEASHHHGYELSPTATEVLRWIATVEAVVHATEPAATRR